MNIYDFKVTTIQGENITLDAYKNKAFLIVNVASECAFTSQYEELEALYQKYKDEDFIILAFPSNEFGGQEPAANEEILNFCSTTYGVSFPIFAKIKVNGEKAHPLYKFLKSEKTGVFGSKNIKWNFTKFLVDKSGTVIQRYASSTKPLSIEKDIKKIIV